jgi:hypothetical protein
MHSSIHFPMHKNTYKHSYFKILSLLSLVITVFSVPASKAIPLSDKAEISLLTCTPGSELYSTFGHSAIRVKDPASGIDWVYNYGTFDFNTPNFYGKFVQGKLNYMLSRPSIDSFMLEYVVENRGVREQVLDLTQEQKQAISDFLENNHKPENKYYLYEFFYDNCSTRIRDVLEKILGKKLTFVEISDIKGKSFRDLLDIYLEKLPWSHFGINLVLGIPCDKKADSRASTFLPDYLEKSLSLAKIERDGKKIPLVKSESIVLMKQPTEENGFLRFSPNVLLWPVFLLFVLITIFEIWKSKFYYGFDVAIYIIVGLLGCLISYLWFISDHKTTINNLNFFWALPFHLIAAFFLFKKKIPVYIKYYFLITGCLGILILPLWFVFPQRFDIAIIPIILLLGMRAISFYFYKFELSRK